MINARTGLQAAPSSTLELNAAASERQNISRTNVFSDSEKYEKEAYELSPKFGFGDARLNADGLGDAFRHAYVSGRFVQEYGGNVAKALGDINEIVFGEGGPSSNMDYNNNSVGRAIGEAIKSGNEDLAWGIWNAAVKGELHVVENVENPVSGKKEKTERPVTVKDMGGYQNDRLEDRYTPGKEPKDPLVGDSPGTIVA